MGAPKGNKNGIGNKGGGRDSLYKPEYNKTVFSLALLGAIDQEIADAFGVCLKTIDNWKNNEIGFYTHLKKGKIEADANVAKRLYKRALGYDYKEVKTKEEPAPPELQDLLGDEMFTTEITTTVKHMAPDIAAINIWLKNRRGRIDPEKGQKWADRHEVDHTTGGEKIRPNITVVDKDTLDNLNKLFKEE